MGQVRTSGSFLPLSNIFVWRALSKFKGFKMFKELTLNRLFFLIIIIDFKDQEAYI